jgi:hypothetical protein
VSTQEGRDITLAVHHNEELSADARELDVFVAVTAGSAGSPGSTQAVATVLLLDCSSTMLFPRSKMIQARRAAIAAVEALRDGALFAVVRGASEATLIYPERPELAVADDRTRAAAITRINQVQAHGGTSIGTWLALARDLFAAHPEVVGHALLLTDGQDESESLAHLNSVLDSCEGKFGCDARGIGEDYEPTQLRRIVSVLRGRADAVVDESQLAGEFCAIVERVRAEPHPGLTLRIDTMPLARLRFVRQIDPDHYNLTDRCRQAPAGRVELGTGPLAVGSTREYHVRIGIAPEKHIVFDRAEHIASVELVGASPAYPIRARWSNEPPPHTVLPPARVRRSDQRDQLIEAMERGRAAYEAADAATAQAQWGQAVRLARELQDADMLTLLAKLVDIRDPAIGDVQLRAGLDRSAILAAHIGSVISNRAARVSRPVLGGDPVTCPACGQKSPGGSTFCEACGTRL